MGRYAKANWFVRGKYNLDGRFEEVTEFGTSLADFFSKFSGDPFLVEEVKDVQSLVEEIFTDTPLLPLQRCLSDCLENELGVELAIRVTATCDDGSKCGLWRRELMLRALMCNVQEISGTN